VSAETLRWFQSTRGAAGSWRMVASNTSVVTQDPPAQEVSRAGWAGFVGRYRLLPDGWTFTVELREGTLGATPRSSGRSSP